MESPGNHTPQGKRYPLADATCRVNNCPSPESERRDRVQRIRDQLKSPDRKSVQTSPMSMKGHTDQNQLSVAVESGSNRSSAISTMSITSGKGKRKTHVGPWQLGKTLGKGATGRVRLAKHAVTGQAAAIKIVSKKSAAMVQSESIAAMDRNASLFSGTAGTRQMPCGIEREVVIMKLIEHPNVISLYDVWENRGELYLVLEYVEGGELFDYVSSHGPLPEEEAVRLFRQIIAGLAYCHRFNICHRDLKPENILLDANHNIKLADFGMAALQPAGHWLNTSCGSPHYAAPEIIYGDRYRGDKADMWSCGIILFALLTGFLPFDGGDLPNTLRLVKKGEYFLPPWLSDEAADLIQRILQKRPEDRISMRDIWMHPLLKKYEKLHQAMSDYFVGPPPPLSGKDCGPPVDGRQDIDPDILRNLQTLWHGVKPDALIERLLSLEPSHERMFYNALLKFRDEQLENYQGQPLEYSASDYHHISRPALRVSARRSQNGRRPGHLRRRCHFSVATDGTSRFMNSIKEPRSSGTVESYDPYRSPHSHMGGEAEYAQITVHRKVSIASHKASIPEHVVEDTLDAMDVDDDMSEENAGAYPSSPYAVLANKKSNINSFKSFQSRVSHSSSRRGMNGPATARSASYKRNVSFRHVRNRSQGSTSGKMTKGPPAQRKVSSELSSAKVFVKENFPSDVVDSPHLPTQPKVVRSGVATMRNSGMEVKKAREANYAWREEARQVSHELSQICEEAFNGTSMSTVSTASICGGCDTPATSVCTASPEPLQPMMSGAKVRSKPLPDGPAEFPRSYSLAKLTETRRKLIEYSSKDGSEEILADLARVIACMDRLIEQDMSKHKQKPLAIDDCDPFTRSAIDAGQLPPIREELPTPVHSDPQLQSRAREARNMSQPSTRSSLFSRDGKTTIRMVPHESMRSLEEIKPLTIRKKNRPTTAKATEPAEELFERLERYDSGSPTRYMSSSSQPGRSPCGLDPIDEVPPRSPRRSQVRAPGENVKKWTWFKQKPQAAGDDNTPHKILSDAQQIHPSNTTVVVHEVKPADVVRKASNETDCSHFSSSSAKSKGGFLRKLIKKKSSSSKEQDVRVAAGDYQDPEAILVATAASSAAGSLRNVSYETITSQKPGAESQTTNLHLPSPKNQNWFARVFQIKPATRVAALNTSKVKAWRDVYRILRDWKQYGIEQVLLDKANSTIRGRVGDDNLLRLNPVEFSAEFYTVLEHGRQANLSLVRFRQDRGAASSFHKVVDTLCNVLKQRGILVEDPVRAKKMTRVLDAF
ncbi:hypothetical protein ASPZODRAFT_74966 [Penicilliopsis zonata CBS 506.65]|uniref:non-specific serine/threonine protein kinase n=1 Tax=Penicilliopsis zonata CBS 506.65 TaxID=1073090 RepID=A0A1L9S7H4_9EURO|nr:hypothetical protein ASPZODRAFT_74966 [Penicilliopsis zonata CBS 506.65]OJJ43112.1 hypothetical protein ASPZODRAFT_74966 [Penicilliopsis zonata CBS 506.65]